MNDIKRIFGKIWGVYGVIVFFIMVVLFFPFYLIFLGIKSADLTRIVILFNHRVFPRIFFPLVGIHLQVRGKGILDPKTHYIIISNHKSAIDFLANPVAFPGVYKFLAKKELTRIPLMGFVVKRLCVLVDRKDASSASQSLLGLKKTLEENYSIFIYPEGTRNRTEEQLGPFFSGAFRLSKELNVPIAVMTLRNVHKRCPNANSFDLRPGVLKMKWSGLLDPIAFSSHQEMMEAAKGMMIADLEP